MTLDQKIREHRALDHVRTQPVAGDAWHQAGAAVLAVLDLHNEFRIYGECGHQHTETGNGVLDVENVGLTCEDGYEYSICRSCCSDGDSYQTEQCVDTHKHPCWPCPTHHVIATALDIDAAAVTR